MNFILDNKSPRASLASIYSVAVWQVLWFSETISIGLLIWFSLQPSLTCWMEWSQEHCMLLPQSEKNLRADSQLWICSRVIVFKLLQMSNLSTIIESNSLRQILQFFPFLSPFFQLSDWQNLTLIPGKALHLSDYQPRKYALSSIISINVKTGSECFWTHNSWIRTSLSSSPLFVPFCWFRVAALFLKFKDMSFKNNKFQYILLLISALLIPFFSLQPSPSL